MEDVLKKTRNRERGIYPLIYPLLSSTLERKEQSHDEEW
jgi:hypothetical protein